MKNIKTLFLSFFVLAFVACTSQKTEEKVEADESPVDENVQTSGIKGEELSYNSDTVTMKGYLAYDTGKEGKRPGILIVHEWWGHNDYSRKRADMLAELGFVALAVDMYGDGTQAEHPKDAGAFAGQVMNNMDGAKDRFMAAYEVLKNHPNVDINKTAAIGYCFGGGVVLNMARMGVDLVGVVSFHGSLATSMPAQAGMVKSKILVCHGAEDSFIPQEHIDNFKKEMEDAGATMYFVEYEDAKHSFTNPDADAIDEKFQIGVAYNERADLVSWRDMQDFLGDIFAAVDESEN